MVPPGFNIALVAFAGTASVIVPPTTDRGMVAGAIENLEVAPSTAIGEGIYSSLDAIALAPPDPDHPDDPAPAAIVLLCDGYTNIGRPSAAGGPVQAKELGVPIYTIAYGTQHGYVETTGGRTEGASRCRWTTTSWRDRADLRRQEVLRPSSTELQAGLQASIARSVGYAKVDQEVTEQYAGYALVFAVLASLAVISLAARWP